MVVGCTSLAHVRDMCGMHYERWRKHGHTGDTRRVTPVCSVDGCDALSIAKGLCSKHYYRVKRTGTTDMSDADPLICSFEGCDKPHAAHGFCNTHYRRLHRHGTVAPTRPADWGAREKHPLYRCWNALIRYNAKVTCEEWKDFWAFVGAVGERPSPKHTISRVNEDTFFQPGNVFWREPRRDTKTQEAKKQAADYARIWRIANLDRTIDVDLRKKYGIGLQDYNAMYENQGGLCAICRCQETRVDHRTETTSRMAVDHDHKTGRLRDLLCHACNTALGGFKDDPDLLRKAVDYLEFHAKIAHRSSEFSSVQEGTKTLN